VTSIRIVRSRGSGNATCSRVLGTNPAAVVPAKAVEDAHVSTNAGLQLGRAVPQRSLPPCAPLWGRDRERGTTALRLFMARPSKCCQPSLSTLCRRQSSRSVLHRPPLSLSLPHKGGGNRGARAFATHAMCVRDFQRCVHNLARRRGPITTRVSVIAGPATSLCCCVWVPAFAGTTAESHCFTSSKAGFQGDERLRRCASTSSQKYIRFISLSISISALLSRTAPRDATPSRAHP
jgi:hypothetical protein